MKKKRYINNKDFADSLIEWVKLCKSNTGKHRPDIPMYIAECFMKIVNGLGQKRNFSGYTYLPDMKSEALEHCVKYADRFNSEKSTNAFSYFTQITYNAFIQYINREKKLATFKFEMTRESVENAHKWDYNRIASKREGVE